MLRAPREIGVGISPQVEPGVSADENSKLGDGALHAESTLTLRLFRLAAHCNWPSRFRISPAFRSKSNSDLSASAALSLAGPLSVHLEDLRRRARKLARRAESGCGSYAALCCSNHAPLGRIAVSSPESLLEGDDSNYLYRATASFAVTGCSSYIGK